ncbi:MAG TPA: hypothetical protein PK095_26035, partial [Myxococcota bacterium]|nr:hypothetical protein [Myxococcota bacterium]
MRTSPGAGTRDAGLPIGWGGSWARSVASAALSAVVALVAVGAPTPPAARAVEFRIESHTLG